MQVQTSVSIVLGIRPPEFPGTFYITSKYSFSSCYAKIMWLSDVGRAKGYAVDFLSLSLNAVSRHPKAYPSPCIYTQIEIEDGDEDEDKGHAKNGEALDLLEVSKMSLVPSNGSQLDNLFEISW